jgi:hypothetical protein
LPARYVPSAGFGYPLDGLLHPSPCRACFVPAALLGFALRSLLLLKGIRAFPRGRAHVPFLPAVSPAAEAEGRPTGPRFLGFNPFRSPVATGHVISAPTAGCSLGLRPSRVFRRNAPAETFARPPLTRFRVAVRKTAAPAPQSLLRFHLDSPTFPASRAAGRINPFRVPAPVRLRTFERAAARAMSSPHAAIDITVGR